MQRRRHERCSCARARYAFGAPCGAFMSGPRRCRHHSLLARRPGDEAPAAAPPSTLVRGRPGDGGGRISAATSPESSASGRVAVDTRRRRPSVPACMPMDALRMAAPAAGGAAPGAPIVRRARPPGACAAVARRGDARERSGAPLCGAWPTRLGASVPPAQRGRVLLAGCLVHQR